MSNQDFRPNPQGNSRTSAGSPQGTAKDTISAAASLAGQAAETAKDALSETTATLTGEMKQLLDRQVGSGAKVLGTVARSTRRVADELEQESPQVAGLVRTLGHRVDRFADDLEGQSADQILRTVSDFTRRQPALVFGLAAIAGFFVLRTLKSAPPASAPSIAPSLSVGDFNAS